MRIEEFLKQQKTVILELWANSVLDTYSPDGSKIFKTRKDRFSNPVGYNVRQGLTDVYDAFCEKTESEKGVSALEELVKVRAVQDFSPAESVSFVFFLKRIVRERCRKEKVLFTDDDLSVLDSRLDALALRVFDLYMACREKLYQIQMNEYKRGTHVLTDGTKCGPPIMRRSQIENGIN